MTQKLSEDILDYLIQKKRISIIKKNLKSEEDALLKKLKIETPNLNLKKATKRIKSGLFGYPSIITDYTQDDCVVEFKYIKRNTTTKNECEVKNGMSQVIEQGIIYRKKYAILVLIDTGNAKLRQLDTTEIVFINMFKKNPFGIELDVVRFTPFSPNCSKIY